MDKRKIIIVNLAKGLVGEANTALLGSMLTTRLYLAAMSRADVSNAELARLPNFYFYIDEFQSIANASFADILSEARKYKLNLTLAHQYVEQMPEELQAAVFGNVGTSIAFRVGPLDAELMEKQFAPKFMAQDFINLGFAQIYLSLMIDGVGSPPFSARTIAPIEPPARSFREEIIRRSREQFAKPKAEVEEAIIEWHKPAKAQMRETAPAPRREPLRREIPQVERKERAPHIPKPVVNQALNQVANEVASQNNPPPADVLKNREGNRRSRNESGIRPPAPISLKELAQKESKAVPSKNLEELRRILSELKPAPGEQKKPEQKNLTEEKGPVPSLANPIREDRGALSNGVKEVPEDELRRMVSIDDE